MEVSVKQEVIGTVRSPDGVTSAPIDGLVLRGTGNGHPVIDKSTAIKRAKAGLLWTHIPGDGRRVAIVAVDRDGDGVDDYVRTKPDETIRNNLLDLPIWDRERRVWLDATTGAVAYAP